MVTEDNGSRFLRRVGKYLPNYELLILGDCRIREDPKSHSIQTPPPFLRSLQHRMLVYTYAAASNWLQYQKQHMCAANPCPVLYGKSRASPSEDILLKAITFRKNKVASSYDTMPK